MPHGPFKHRHRDKSGRQDGVDELSRLFGLDTSTDSSQSTPTAIVDSPIAITPTATSSSTPVSSCTYLRLLRMDLNSLPSSPLHCIVYPDVLIDPFNYEHFFHSQYLICYLDANYYSTSKPYLGFYSSSYSHSFSLRTPPRPLLARYPVSQSVEPLLPALVPPTPLSVERVPASLLVVFSLLSFALRVLCLLPLTFWLVPYTFFPAKIFLTILSEEVSP